MKRSVFLVVFSLIVALSLPRFETWLAFPSNEEIGAVGAAYLASQIRPTDTIALGILPLSDQCFVKDVHAPYLLSRDRYCVYDQRLNDEIRDAAMKAGIHIGVSTLAEYGSGASISKRYGRSPREAGGRRSPNSAKSPCNAPSSKAG